MEQTTPTDHCICPEGEHCSCGFAAMLSRIFFGEEGKP